MGLDFLHNHGGRRVRNYEVQPLLLDDGLMQSEVPEGTAIDLNREKPCEKWEPIDVAEAIIPSDWPLRPMRFVDGKDIGRTVAWLQTREGYPVPVRLSEIGAVVMRNIEGGLRREFAVVERVVSLIIDPFPWDEIESFAIALQEQRFRLLPCREPLEGMSYNFEQMRATTQYRTKDEMSRLERQGMARASSVPTLVDGRLEPHARAFDEEHMPVVGLIKKHQQNYLHAQGWRVFYDLEPGQRTPAFLLAEKNIRVLSWYLRLVGSNGELPNWGVVRLEIPEAFFVKTLSEDWEYLNRLSRLICEYRCRDQDYSRAPVSIHPIQRAEESLGSLFTQSDTIINRFYRLTNL